jgi:glycosyltransferase involved in cell wall biosynthesis
VVEPAGKETSRARVLAVRMEATDWRVSFSKTSGLYRPLAERVDLVDVVNPVPGLVERAASAGGRRSGAVRRLSAGLGIETRLLHGRARAVERLIEQRHGRYDVLLADETLAFVPPGVRRDRPYVIYTDNTYACTRRFYPQWLGPSASENDRLEAYEREVFRSARSVCCMSEFVARSAIEDYGCREDHVHVVGAGTAAVALDDSERLLQPTALFVGFDFNVKGGSTLLAAWELVQARLPEARLWMVGPPPRPGDASIHWFGRVGDREQLSALFRQASLFVIPARYEAFGIAFIEAMMHGLPAIGTRLCALPELIADGQTGLLVDVDAPEQLANALLELLSDLPRCREMGAAAHRRVADSFTWDRVADRLLPALS